MSYTIYLEMQHQPKEMMRSEEKLTVFHLNKGSIECIAWSMHCATCKYLVACVCSGSLFLFQTRVYSLNLRKKKQFFEPESVYLK